MAIKVRLISGRRSYGLHILRLSVGRMCDEAILRQYTEERRPMSKLV